MKRPALFILGIFLFIGALSAYVLLSVAGDLGAVKDMLDEDTGDIEAGDLRRADELLSRAEDRLSSPPALMVRWVPVVGQNVTALREVADAGLSVIAAAQGVRAELQRFEDRGVVEGGRLDQQALSALGAPLQRQLDSVEALTLAARDNLGPWLFPPVWDGLREVDLRGASLVTDLQIARQALEMAGPLSGSEGRRRYLVLLMNNAELRGAGGVLTGVGTVTIDEGRISLGRFDEVHALQDDPPQKVAAPEDFRRRFGQYKADTTLWLNTTFSPDVPDVAKVAATLYEKQTGTETDGAFLIDPVAIARLLPEDWSVPLPLYDREVEGDEIDDFIFSDGYSLYADQAQRRATILKIGRFAFLSVLQRGFGAETLAELGKLAAGGHVRVVSFDESEQLTLQALGVTGDLSGTARPARTIRVTAQNFGSDAGQGTKLDHWARRSLEVRCAVEEEVACRVSTTIENAAPEKLPAYVAGDGVLRSYLETYIPAGSEVAGVELDGSPVEFRTEEEEGQLAIGVFLELDRAAAGTVEVTFTAPPAEGPFRLVIEPQPLSKPARIDALIAVPEEWRTSGPGTSTPEGLRYEGSFDSRLTFSASPETPPGLSRLWEGVLDFWRSPLF